MHGLCKCMLFRGGQKRTQKGKNWVSSVVLVLKMSFKELENLRLHSPNIKPLLEDQFGIPLSPSSVATSNFHVYWRYSGLKLGT